MDAQLIEHDYKILCFGDSLTEGYYSFGLHFHPYTIKLKQLLRAAGHVVTIENHGISGDTTYGMVPRFNRVISEYSFNAAIILGGTNDLKYPAKQTVENLKAMHNVASAHGITTFALTIPEMAVEKYNKDASETRKNINQMLREYCKENSVPVIDIDVLIPLHSMKPSDRNKVWDDGCHFTAYGYDLLGEIIFDHIINIFV